MNEYAAVTILIALLMAAMTIHALAYSGFNKRQKVWFVLTFLTIAFCSGAEFAVHCGYYDPAFAIPLTILTVIQFSLSPLMAMFFAGALGLSNQEKVAIGFFAATLVTQIVCAPMGLIFRFDETGYHRGNGFLIYEIFYFVSLLYLIVSLIVAGRKFLHRDRATIIMILVILVAGIVPMTIWSTHVAYFAIAMSSCLCYIYYNDLTQEDTRTALIDSQRKMSDMQEHTIAGLANLIESRDTETGEHVMRTSELVRMIALQAKEEGVYAEELSDEFIELLYKLAPMHDVGKIVVSDRILRKPGKLTNAEREEMKKHAEYGGTVVRRILSGITDERYIQIASDIATYHHEKWDGNGYPKMLSGEDIPLSARIMAIADVFDALVSKRCYKEPMSFEEAIEIIEQGAGVHFDPKLAAVFLKHKEDYRGFATEAKVE